MWTSDGPIRTIGPMKMLIFDPRKDIGHADHIACEDPGCVTSSGHQDIHHSTSGTTRSVLQALDQELQTGDCSKVWKFLCRA